MSYKGEIFVFIGLDEKSNMAAPAALQDKLFRYDTFISCRCFSKKCENNAAIEFFESFSPIKHCSGTNPPPAATTSRCSISILGVIS